MTSNIFSCATITMINYRTFSSPPKGHPYLLAVVVYSLNRVWLFYDPMDCSPPGSSVYGIFQARILEWGAISSSRGSSQGLNPWLLHWQADSLPLGHQGSLWAVTPSHFPHPPALEPLETTNLLSISVDFPPLDILDKWNNKICGLSCLASFT